MTNNTKARKQQENKEKVIRMKKTKQYEENQKRNNQ